jgi:putative transferase (TIGR04331 family)
MAPEAEPYFELLRKAGILYRTPEEAARKLQEVFDNPSKWWSGKEVQRARCEFLDVFGYTEKDWTGAWARELKRLERE